MAVTFVAVGALAANATNTNLATVGPACAVDDILIYAGLGKNNQVVSPPDGSWTVFKEGNNTVNMRYTLAWKRAVSGDTGGISYAFTKPVDDNLLNCGVISAWRGCITSGSPIDATAPTNQNTAAGDTVNYASFDPSGPCHVVAVGFYNQDLTTAGTISGTDPTLGLRWDLETATGGDGSIFGYSGDSSGAATGARSHSTTSTADDVSTGVLFGLVVASTAAQDLTGTLFTKAPTFSTGAVTSVRNLAGALFTKAPTFSTGTVTSVQNLVGVLFQKAPTFFAGAFDAGPAFLTGTLFTKAPTFGTGTMGWGLVGVSTGYLHLPGTSNAHAATPDHTSLDITGDIDIRLLVTAADWTPAGGLQRLISKRSGTTDRSWTFYIAANGDLGWNWSSDGTGGTGGFNESGPAAGGTDGQPLWVRVTHDVDDGASQNVVTFYTSTDPITTDPASVSWTQLSQHTNSGVTSFFNSTTSVTLGVTAPTEGNELAGKIYYAEIRNGIAGTIVASPDYRDRDQLTSDTVVTDTQGRVWTAVSPAAWHIPYIDGPTFPQGALTSTYGLAGALFTKAPSFFGGSFISGPVILSGTLFQKAPTFFAGTVVQAQALIGTLFTKAPTFPQGTVAAGAVNLAGVLYENEPSFFDGEVLAGSVDLAGVLFTKAPTFFVGTITVGAVNLSGVLFQKAPSFFAAVVGQEGGPQLLGGTLFTKAPIFPQGTVSTGAVGLTGVLFQKAPTFNQGSVASSFTLVGVLFQKAPTFPQGGLIQEQILVGVLFENTPQFFQGAMGTGALDGVLFVSTPTFFVGVLTQGERVFPTWPASTGNGWETGEGVDWPVSTNPEWEVVS